MGVDGSAKEKVEQTSNTLGLQEIDMVLGQYKVIFRVPICHTKDSNDFTHHLGLPVSTCIPLPQGLYSCP